MSCVPIFRDVLWQVLETNKTSFSVFLNLLLPLHLHENNTGVKSFKNYKEIATLCGLAINTVKKGVEELESKKIIEATKDYRHRTIKIKLNFERPNEHNTKGHKGGYIKLPLAGLFYQKLSGVALKVWVFNFLCTKGLYDKKTKILNIWAQNDLGLSRSSVTKANNELKEKGLQDFTIENKTGHHIFNLNKPTGKLMKPVKKSNNSAQKSKSNVQKSEFSHNYKDSSSSKKNSKNPSLKESSLAPIKDILQKNGLSKNQEGVIDICINELKKKGIMTKNGRFVKCEDPLKYLMAKREEHGTPAVVKVYERYLQDKQKNQIEEMKKLSLEEMKIVYIQEMAGNEEDFNLLINNSRINTTDESRIKSRLATNLTDISKTLLNHIKGPTGCQRNQITLGTKHQDPPSLDQSSVSVAFNSMIKTLWSAT